MKKNLFKNVAFAAIAGLALTACNKQQPQVEDKTQAPAAASQLKIAYVEVDSIMTQYTFAKEYSSLLEKKSVNIQKTIAQKGQALQAAAANFQQKIQQNAYTREQAEAIQAGLQKQQADLQGLQQRLGNEFQAIIRLFTILSQIILRYIIRIRNIVLSSVSKVIICFMQTRLMM